MLGAEGIDFTSFVPRIAIEMHASGDGAVHRRVPGSMVFVDISGFTAMSERLARFGKVGAEEVTEVLDFAFTRLLAVAYENDGSLLKFGGDALLLFFAGENDAARATHAAHGMREKLRELGGLDSSAGKVHLKMSVGVHTGEFDFFLVGESHRDLVVSGPAASQTVRMEGTADAGEIVLSKATADAMTEAVVGQAKGDGFLLRRGPTPPRIPRAVWGVKGDVDASHLLPRAIREHLRDGVTASEHRPAVIAFVHFDGVDALIENEGPEAALAKLDELVAIVQRAADDHDVSFVSSDVDIDGGKFILSGGVPSFHVDDEERVLRTLRAIVDAKPPLPLKLGANRGALFAGVVGPPYRMTYTVMGDTVNLAARVMARADHGEVLATPLVLERSRAQFDVEAIEPFHAKGKAEPVEAFRIGSLAGRHTGRRGDARRLPLVGRDAEMARLVELWEDARTGSGAVVELLGPAGIGKSRLIYEFRDAAQPRYHVMAECDQYESSTPYHAFRGLLRHVLGVTETDDPDEQARRLRERVRACGRDLEPWIPLIALVADISVPSTQEVDDLGPRFRAPRLREVVTELLTRLLSSPTMLRIEDAHWMDEASRELLAHLITEGVTRAPWLVTVATREPGLGGPDAEIIDLQPVGPEAAQQLAHRAAEMGLIQLAQVDEIIARAGGHPLFLQELVNHAADGESLPDSIETLIGARIDRLPSGARLLLRHAALLGQRFDLGLLRSITGQAVEPETLGVLTEFVRHVEGDDYEFEHALFRDTAYAALNYRTRRELHDMAGRVIETRYMGRTDEAAEILALHYYRAERHDRAWQFNRIAAERSKERFANDTAIRFYRWAIESGQRSETAEADSLTELYVELGNLLEIVGSYDAADDAYRAGRKYASPEAEPDLLYRQGVVRERTSEFSSAIRWYRRAQRAIGDLVFRDDSHAANLALRIQLREAEVRIRQGRGADALAIAKPILENLHENADPAIVARAHFVIAWAMRGDTMAHLHRMEALKIYEELGDIAEQANVWMQGGNDAYYEGRWADAADHWRMAGDLKGRVGDSVGQAIAVSNAGEIHNDRGLHQEAMAAFTESRQVWQAAGFRLGLGVADHNLGRLAARQGRWDEARVRLDAAILTFQALGSPAYELESLARLAELAHFEGDATTCASRARTVMSASSAPAGARLLAHRVHAMVELASDPAAAVTALRDITTATDPVGSRFEHACTELALARALKVAGADEEAIVLDARATAALDGLGILVPADELLDGPGRTVVSGTQGPR